MSKCPGLHCPGCGGGGGSGASALLVLLAVIIIAAIARPVVHAAEVVLEVTLITVSSVAGLAVLGGAGAVQWGAEYRTGGQAGAEHRGAIWAAECHARRDCCAGGCAIGAQSEGGCLSEGRSGEGGG